MLPPFGDAPLAPSDRINGTLPVVLEMRCLSNAVSLVDEAEGNLPADEVSVRKRLSSLGYPEAPHAMATFACAVAGAKTRGTGSLRTDQPWATGVSTMGHAGEVRGGKGELKGEGQRSGCVCVALMQSSG